MAKVDATFASTHSMVSVLRELHDLQGKHASASKAIAQMPVSPAAPGNAAGQEAFEKANGPASGSARAGEQASAQATLKATQDPQSTAAVKGIDDLQPLLDQISSLEGTLSKVMASLGAEQNERTSGVFDAMAALLGEVRQAKVEIAGLIDSATTPATPSPIGNGNALMPVLESVRQRDRDIQALDDARPEPATGIILDALAPALKKVREMQVARAQLNPTTQTASTLATHPDAAARLSAFEHANERTSAPNTHAAAASPHAAFNVAAATTETTTERSTVAPVSNVPQRNDFQLEQAAHVPDTPRR